MRPIWLPVILQKPKHLSLEKNKQTTKTASHSAYFLSWSSKGKSVAAESRRECRQDRIFAPLVSNAVKVAAGVGDGTGGVVDGRASRQLSEELNGISTDHIRLAANVAQLTTSQY
ncbi:hypothetical protein BaRGS_00011144 [Batillaria attramentaria]|uniref:Uncharacterized protein n=1 Tax=Batillaria attramentaria TaxID=370345 RepID=A0ABD0LD65_9CAEN